jgi:hypothetical protein
VNSSNNRPLVDDLIRPPHFDEASGRTVTCTVFSDLLSMVVQTEVVRAIIITII